MARALARCLMLLNGATPVPTRSVTSSNHAQCDLPNLQRYGLGNIRPLQGLPPLDAPEGSYGRCALRSNGKDTTTGHWEMAGIILERAFPTYPNGFPPNVIDRFVKETSVPGILGNIPASGTEIIKVLGRGTREDAQADRLHVGGFSVSDCSSRRSDSARSAL